MGKYYRTGEPDGPVLLAEYNGIKPGDRVAYENPAFRNPDGTFKTTGLVDRLIVDEIYDMGGDQGFVQAILNDGVYEVSARNLRVIPMEGEPPPGTRLVWIGDRQVSVPERELPDPTPGYPGPYCDAKHPHSGVICTLAPHIREIWHISHDPAGVRAMWGDQ